MLAHELFEKFNQRIKEVKMIRKIGARKYRIYSVSSGKNLGTFPSRKKALKHEMEIEFFKHKK